MEIIRRGSATVRLDSNVGDDGRDRLTRAIGRLPFIDTVKVEHNSSHAGSVILTIRGDARHRSRPDPNPLPRIRLSGRKGWSADHGGMTPLERVEAIEAWCGRRSHRRWTVVGYSGTRGRDGRLRSFVGFESQRRFSEQECATLYAASLSAINAGNGMTYAAVSEASGMKS